MPHGLWTQPIAFQVLVALILCEVLLNYRKYASNFRWQLLSDLWTYDVTELQLWYYNVMFWSRRNLICRSKTLGVWPNEESYGYNIGTRRPSNNARETTGRDRHICLRKWRRSVWSTYQPSRLIVFNRSDDVFFCSKFV